MSAGFVAVDSVNEEKPRLFSKKWFKALAFGFKFHKYKAEHWGCNIVSTLCTQAFNAIAVSSWWLLKTKVPWLAAMLASGWEVFCGIVSAAFKAAVHFFISSN